MFAVYSPTCNVTVEGLLHFWWVIWKRSLAWDCHFWCIVGPISMTKNPWVSLVRRSWWGLWWIPARSSRQSLEDCPSSALHLNTKWQLLKSRGGCPRLSAMPHYWEVFSEGTWGHAVGAWSLDRWWGMKNKKHQGDIFNIYVTFIPNTEF